jgi:predicted membrane channel-forming protein YqfA (hemolysin III family)
MGFTFYIMLGVLSGLPAGGVMIYMFCKRAWQRLAGIILILLGLAALLMIMDMFEALGGLHAFSMS